MIRTAIDVRSGVHMLALFASAWVGAPDARANGTEQLDQLEIGAGVWLVPATMSGLGSKRRAS